MDDVLKAQLGILSRTVGPSKPAVGLFFFSIFAPTPCVIKYEIFTGFKISTFKILRIRRPDLDKYRDFYEP